MPDIADVWPTDEPADVYERMVADMGMAPEGRPWDTREGTGIHALLMPVALEEARIMDRLRDTVSTGFLFWAEGQALDAKAGEYGLVRLDASRATVLLTFSGEDGTVIPSGATLMSVADATGSQTFTTQQTVTIVDGFAEVVAQAVDPGEAGNVSAGSITVLLDAILGVSSVTNYLSASGGSDEEDDDSLRERALLRAGQQPQGGNNDTYVALALTDPEVQAAYVEDLWDTVDVYAGTKSGNGTARLVVSGRNTAYVPPYAIDRLQSRIDPTQITAAHFEPPESWRVTSGSAADVSFYTDSPLAGASSLRVKAAAGATTEASWILDTPLDLSRFYGGEFWIEVKSLLGAPVGNVVAKIILESPDGTHKVWRGIADEYMGSSFGWENIDAQWVNISGTESELFKQVGVIRVQAIADATNPADILFDNIRLRMAQGGLGEGAANIGIQVMVRSAKQTAIDVDVSILPESGTTVAGLQSSLEDSLSDYFESLAPGSLLRLTSIANVIHDTPGVLDYSGVEINRAGTATAAANLDLAADEKPRLGTLTLAAL